MDDIWGQRQKHLQYVSTRVCLRKRRRRRRSRRQPWGGQCDVLGASHMDPTMTHFLPSHTYIQPPPPFTFLQVHIHACVHTHPHLTPVISAFYPPSILPSISNTSSVLLHCPHPSSFTRTLEEEKKHTGAGWPWDRIWWWWFIGVSVMGQRLALGWMDTLDWANKAHMDLLDDRLTGQAAGRRAKWLTGQVGCRAGLGTDPVHRVVHHKTDTVITVTEVKLARTW